MNYNPLENIECQYKITELYIVNEDECEWNRLSDNEEILKKWELNYGGYDSLLYSITDSITWILKSGFNDYQGDYYFVGEDIDGKIYYLNGGYGSCSGCDSYQASEGNIKEFEELRDNIKRSIIQFADLDELKEYIESDLIKGSYGYYSDDFNGFVKEINEKFSWNIEIEKD